MGSVADLTSADVEAIKDFLAYIRAELFRLLPVPAWEPAWLSDASSELRNAENGPECAWGELPVRTVYAMAIVFLVAAMDCMDGLSDLVTVQTTAPTVNVLARAAMENRSTAVVALGARDRRQGPGRSLSADRSSALRNPRIQSLAGSSSSWFAEVHYVGQSRMVVRMRTGMDENELLLELQLRVIHQRRGRIRRLPSFPEGCGSRRAGTSQAA
jgi:hypothetical protein